MINIIIFSKDRACQLDLLLRSMKALFLEHKLCKVSILYKYSDAKYMAGYDRTKAYHPEFNYVLEDSTGFKSQLLGLIDEKVYLTMFLVDDIVFKNYFFLRVDEMKTFLNRRDILCLSLRLHPKIEYCYTEKRSTPPPVLNEDGTWLWKGLPGDWGYPHSLDAHIYRTVEIMPLMKSLSYQNPNTLEGAWANYPPNNQPYMICFRESKIVNNPINKVQTANGNHCGSISAFELNSVYLRGNRIRLEPFISINNVSAHQELPIIFIKRDIYTLSEFISEINKNYIDYREVLENSIYVPRMGGADINVFIPIRGRENFIRPCVSYLQSAAQESSYKCRIIIIENDDTPNNRAIVEALGVDYIFIPNTVSQSNKMFAKSLCYNVAYLLTNKTKWNIFHDIDILVEPDFFKKLKGYLDKDPRWVQPYTKRRVLRLSDTYTQKICTGDKLLLNSIPLDHVQESNPGSPGGSIVIRSDVFEDVGGYDPEIFFGYAPEDSFIWAKLEAVSEKVDFMTECFANSGTFADDPAIEVYHMFHAFMENENKQYKNMLKFKRSYFEFTHADKFDLVKFKKLILINALDIKR